MQEGMLFKQCWVASMFFRGRVNCGWFRYLRSVGEEVLGSCWSDHGVHQSVSTAGRSRSAT